MASKKSSDSGLQRIIKEVDDLQLPESAKGYFTEVSHSVSTILSKSLLRIVAQAYRRPRSRMGQSGQEVGALREPLESFNREMIEIMRSMQEIFLKDDAFLKHLYKGRMEEVGALLKDDSA
jgi:hypothetical protein